MGTSADPEQLRAQLAELVGISPAYHDIWGEYHQTSTTTRDQILDALDLNADCPETLASIHRDMLNACWRRPLPVVMVHRYQTMQLSLALINQHQSEHHRIRLTSENGEAREFDFTHGELEKLDQLDINGVTIDQVRLPLEPEPEPGYYQIELFDAQHGGTDSTAICSTSLIVAPPGCWWPYADNQPLRGFGVSIQLYSLCSERNWGIGDFSDLASSITTLAQSGVLAIGLNPLHAQLPAQPDQRSPYFPSSRFYLNPLYLDPAVLPEYLELPLTQRQSFDDRAARLRAADLIDYAAVAALKFEAINACFDVFRQSASDERRQQLTLFEQREGTMLERFATFEATQASDSDLAAFRTRYVQWCCDEQLANCAHLASDLGMRLGLYTDLAVGTNAAGADAHNYPDLYVEDMEIGAPPDDFSPDGQRWGLPPWSPVNMQQDRYQTFIQLLRATMRHAGLIRIDHVMGLMQQFWIPRGMDCSDGAYVSFPFFDLLGIVALESQRHQCAVVGEDLGTVPDQVRQAIDNFDLLSTRLTYFEKDWQGDHRFLDPSDYPEKAVVTIGGHDLATLRGYWCGHDLKMLQELDRLGSQQHAENQYRERGYDRGRLLDLLRRNGFEIELDADSSDLDEEHCALLAEQIYCLLARSPARLVLVQLTDVFGQLEQINVPGTVDEVPNWRHRMKPDVESWESHVGLQRLFGRLREAYQFKA